MDKEKLLNELEDLYRQRQEFIDKEDYMKAEEINNQIKEYKQQKLLTTKKNHNDQNKLNCKTLDDKYTRDLAEINKKFLIKETELSNQFVLDENELLNRQKQEREEFEAHFDERAKEVKSKQYLDLTKIKDTLVRQERFVEAAEVKKKADFVYKEDQEKEKMKLQKSYDMQIEKLNKAHLDERNKFQEKKDKFFYLLQKDKNKEIDALNNQFRTMKVEDQLKSKQKEMSETKNLKNTMLRHPSGYTMRSVNKYSK